MAIVGDMIENRRSGQRMVFLKTGSGTKGELLQIECFNLPTKVDEPEHSHPNQLSVAKVLSGTLRFSIHGVGHEIGAGESRTIPAGMAHSFGNHGDDEAHWIQEFSPALRTDAFFEKLFDLAAHGELNERGVPSLLQLALSVPRFAKEITITRPPQAVQRIVFTLLAPIARLRGLRAG
jgi:quercetin dioxygenase-like cupin family protein